MSQEALPSASAPGLIPRLWDQNAVDLELDLQQVGHTLPHALEAVAATAAAAKLRMHEHEPEDLLTASALTLICCIINRLHETLVNTNFQSYINESTPAEIYKG